MGPVGVAIPRQPDRLLAAIGTGDSLVAADALLEMVERPERLDERRLEQELGEILVRLGGPESSANVAGAVAQLFHLVARHELGIPPQLAAAFRAFATLDGTFTVLDPTFNLMRGARAAAESRLESSLHPTEWRNTVEAKLITLLPVLRKIPRRIDRIADAAERGRLHIHTCILADPADRRFVVLLLHQALLTILAATSGLMATVMFLVAPGPIVTEDVGLFQVLAAALLAGSVILVMRLLVVFFRHDEESQ